MSTALRVPGVYFAPQPRAADPPTSRTDVVGFVGFEPRVRPGPVTATTGTPGNPFLVDVAAFQLDVAGKRVSVPANSAFAMTAPAAVVAVPVGQSLVFALAIARQGLDAVLVPVSGTVAASGTEVSPDDATVAAAVATALGGTPPYVRAVDVIVRRDATQLWITIAPALPPLRCDDWRDYVLGFGLPQDHGTMLGPSVQSYFANGGRRCWVTTVRRPQVEDAIERERARQEFVGFRGASQIEATGLERLLLLDDVTACDVPDLYAVRDPRFKRSVPIPAPIREACFVPCTTIAPPGGVATADRRAPGWQPVYDSSGGTASEVFQTQLALLSRARDDRWRMLLLFSVPLVLDNGAGYRMPTWEDADRWRSFFDQLPKLQGFTIEEMACAALYWPWLFYVPASAPPAPGEDPDVLPPSALAAGILARRDLARGPFVGAANETLRQVVGVTQPVDDDSDGLLYQPDPDAGGFPVAAANVFRPFPGYGVQLWGARTLSTDPWLQFLSVRRTLTAIEVRMKRALDLVVFEPNGPALWMQLATVAMSVLLPLYERGAFRGSRPEEAFYIRCDASVNPPESLAVGRLVLEVGVAIAAPAEFIVFRVGRLEGVTEVAE